MAKLNFDPADPLRVTIGKRLRAAREIRRCTARQFGLSLGLDPTAYNKYELGQRSLPPELVPVLCDVLEITADYLYCGSVSSAVSVSVAAAIGSHFPAALRLAEPARQEAGREPETAFSTHPNKKMHKIKA